MDEYIEIPIPSDPGGYISFRCPLCSERFKLSAAEVNERSPEDFHCPICGLSGDAQDFITEDVNEVVKQNAENLVADAVNKMMRDLERSFRGSKFVTVKRGRDIPKHQVNELRETPDLVAVEFACCGATAKVPLTAAEVIVYCPFCGQVRS